MQLRLYEQGPRSVRFLGWFLHSLCPPLWSKRPESDAQAWQQACIKLGPIFIKIGQMLAVRSDVFSAPICKALEVLQDQTTALPWQKLQEVYHHSIAPSARLKMIEVTPLAIASLAQVHRGLTHEHKQVVVKILLPGVRKAVVRDLKCLKVALVIAASLGSRIASRAKVAVDKLGPGLLGETDLQQEAAHTVRAAHLWKQAKIPLKVPKVYWEFSSIDVLVTEYLPGGSLSKTLQTQPLRIKEQVVRKLWTCFLRSVFQVGLFHADWHPGNILVHVESQSKEVSLGLVDFGLIGELSALKKFVLQECSAAMLTQDYWRLIRYHQWIGWWPQSLDVQRLGWDFYRVFGPYVDRTAGSWSFTDLLRSLVVVAREHQLPILSELLLVQKNLCLLEALTRELVPELNLWREVRNIVNCQVLGHTRWVQPVKQLIEQAPCKLWEKAYAHELRTQQEACSVEKFGFYDLGRFWIYRAVAAAFVVGTIYYFLVLAIAFCSLFCSVAF